MTTKPDFTGDGRTVTVRIPISIRRRGGRKLVLAPDGTSNFADLQASFQEGAKNPLTYFCFDLLHLNGRNPRNLPLIERKNLLADLLEQANADQCREGGDPNRQVRSSPGDRD